MPPDLHRKNEALVSESVKKWGVVSKGGPGGPFRKICGTCNKFHEYIYVFVVFPIELLSTKKVVWRKIDVS